MAIDYVVAIPTFIGSWLSFIASATAIVLQIVRPPRRHFRHALIVNLLVSDAMNSLSNAVSGSIFLAQGRMPGGETEPDAACLANAYINQLSVQTIDFNILIISISVLLTVVRFDGLADLSIKFQVLICVAAWVPAIITSNVALALNGYGYVSGNWCWIRADRLDLRYGLTHGWRLAIFFATIIIYTYIYIHLKKTFDKLRNTSTDSTGTSNSCSILGKKVSVNDSDAQQILRSEPYDRTDELHEMAGRSIEDQASSHAALNQSPDGTYNNIFARSHMPPPPNLRKMLLLNGYPIAYIILWIPGIANRLTESLNGSSPQWLRALQASTQFIGLVNALTYGVSEQVRQKAWKKLGSVPGFSRSRG